MDHRAGETLGESEELTAEGVAISVLTVSQRPGQVE